MRKHKLKRSVFVVASTSLLLLSSTAFNAAAEEEEVSNNLSVPAIFAEGYGITGLEAWDKSGLPGSTTPTWGTAYCLPGDQNTKYFLQATDSLWQAEFDANALNVPVPVYVTVDWSKEVIETAWNDKSVIPVSVTLYKDIDVSMTGYNMYTLPADICPCADPDCNEEADSSDVLIASEEEGDEEVVEVFGTMKDDTYQSYRATVFSVCARLKIERIEGKGGEPTEEILNSPLYEGFETLGKPDWLTVTIDGPGKIVYLYNWNIARMQKGKDVSCAGWYRLTFSIDDEVDYTITQGNSSIEVLKVENLQCNTYLDALDPSDIEDGVDEEDANPKLVSPSYTSFDIYISDIMGD